MIAARRSHRNNHPSAFFQLRDERWGNVIGRGGHEDGVERRKLFPTEITISIFRLDIGLTQSLEARRGSFGE